MIQIKDAKSKQDEGVQQIRNVFQEFAAQSDGNPQAEEDEGDPNASYVNTNQTANVTKTNELTTEDLEMFIAAMDANGDGKLGRDEFLDYCMRGMNMRPKQRKKFSKRSPMHAKLQLFITNILKRIETST